jgi:threonine dehydratase
MVRAMDLYDHVVAADARIRPGVRRTELVPSPWLSNLTGGEVRLKLECWQRTGSFKLRGATHKLAVLAPDVRALGVITASTGNHGMGVAQAAADVGCAATVFVPEGADPGKLDTIRSLGAEVRVVGDDCIVSEAAARALSEASGRAYISPYNDVDVAAGQGTIALELLQQWPEMDAVFVSLGGGGLIGGVGSYLKRAAPGVAVVAVSPTNSAVMHHSLVAGKILEMASLPTLSDATAGGVEAGSVTFGLCQRAIDRSILVEEPKIGAALREVVGRHRFLIEGAAALAVAGLIDTAADWKDKRVAVVLCGANIGLGKLASVIG